MRVPQLREDLLDVVLVHAEGPDVHLRALLADEGAVGDVCVGGLTLVAVDAIGIELIVCHGVVQEHAQVLWLSLLEDVLSD